VSGGETWSGPLVLLRDFVVFPKATAPIFVGRETTKRALADAYAGEQEVLLVAQKDAADDDPGPDQIHSLGVVADVLDRSVYADGMMKLRVRGRQRARVNWVAEEGGVRRAEAMLVKGPPADLAASREMVRAALDAVGAYTRARTNIATSETGEKLADIASDIAHPGVLADLIAAIASASVAEKQAVLETLDPTSRLQAAVSLLSRSSAKPVSTWLQRPAP
jgi:ATP-dependent Lon protease